MFVELDTRHSDGLTVRLEWDRDTGQTQIVVHDTRSDGLIAFDVSPVNAGAGNRKPTIQKRAIIPRQILWMAVGIAAASRVGA
jgi:hypothetical protein